ncbi:protein farnesyltransferase/geranylgeranyltransferase type-1 subunit alpha-like isoform X2 [Hylaeus volcanicus]|uniref:protein farnesyltransferase/geranylgeranyltransferase type-1 subunit alpha-like isoform X2 n=1 Tax=Hylaeus volcanicus TaxID=313075 RepID=UPI0023B88224|nr:protein farnesyltransferase/geranylgeranyltransferase type-1 subunit alpha-like isoform X2 [Hylaeus volcanicus]
MVFLKEEKGFENQKEKICSIKCTPSLSYKYSTLYKLYETKHFASEDNLKLTTELIDANESNYTVWRIRRQCLLSWMHSLETKEKNNFLLKELDFIIYYCNQSAKCYQVWYHRRWIMQQMNDVQVASLEKKRIEFNLEEDQKNFNLWQYRTFLQDFIYSNKSCNSASCDNLFFTNPLKMLKKRCNCWLKEEKKFSEFMIALDHRNNSAWNLRVVAVKNHAKALLQMNLFDKATNELRDDILTPHNEPSWNALCSYFFKEDQLLLATTTTCSCQNISTCILCDRARFKWTDSKIQTMITSLIDQVLKQDSTNRFCLYVHYLYCLSLDDYSKCYQILDKLSTVDQQRVTFWNIKKTMFSKYVLSEESDKVFL